MNDNALPKKLLIVCSYYHPYISGLTFVATKIAEYMAAQGYEVTVLCHSHNPSLKNEEVLNGVRVVRANRLFRINRATFSLDFLLMFWKLNKSADIVNMHLPLPEAGFLSLISRKKAIHTYQCDVDNSHFVMRLISKAIDISSVIAFKRADQIVFTSKDYAENSRLYKHARSKLVVIPNFCEKQSLGYPRYRNSEGTHFGFLGRFTSEKGIKVLLEAFKLNKDSSARLIIAGSSVLAGDSVHDFVVQMASSDSRVLIVSNLSEDDKADFFASIDVFCFPSTNSFEAFGIVQVEALFNGLPVIASNLPGVRTIVENKSYGCIVSPGSVSELAAALNREKLNGPSVSDLQEINRRYSMESALRSYWEAFDAII